MALAESSTQGAPGTERKQPLLIKVTILRSGNSGKSTLLKKMELFCTGNWSSSELVLVKDTIFFNLMTSVRSVLEAMKCLEIPLANQDNEYHVRTVLADSSIPD